MGKGAFASDFPVCFCIEGLQMATCTSTCMVTRPGPPPVHKQQSVHQQHSRMQIHKFIHSIWIFSTKYPVPKCVWETDTPAPVDVTPLLYLVDVSASMNLHIRELKEISAAFLGYSNFEYVWNVPELSCQTNLVHSVAFLKKTNALDGKDLVVFTDGVENVICESITMNGVTYDFECKSIDPVMYLNRAADFVVEACDANLYVVGLGKDAKAMEQCLVKRRNVYVAHVDTGESSENIIATVRTVISRGKSGAAQEDEIQQEIFVALSPEVQQTLRDMDKDDFVRVVAASHRVSIGASLKTCIETHEPYVNNKVPNVDVAYNRAALLFILRSMKSDCAIPPSVYYSKHSPVFSQDARLNKAWLNTMLSKLSGDASGLVKVGPKTPNDGVLIKLTDGVERKAAPRAATYKSTVDLNELETLSTLGSWCMPLDSIKLRSPKRLLE